MDINDIFRQLWTNKKRLLQAKWCLRKPRKALVLIYDRTGSNTLCQYIDPAVVNILDTRYETVNLYVVFKSLFSLALVFGGKSKPRGYIDQYIRCVGPSVAITFIDNNPRFYLLKKNHPDLLTVFVQNGWRVETTDIFGMFKNELRNGGPYRVDHMLTFGRTVGKKYGEYIEGEVRVIGSLKNNACDCSVVHQKDSVVFISMFKPRPTVRKQPLWCGYGQSIFWDEFYSAERSVLPFLKGYCERKNLKLKVCARSSDNKSEEYGYFASLLGDQGWEFLFRLNAYSSYEYVERAEFVVSIDSTLGYEALARGKRIALFPLRGKKVPMLAAHNFGWPGNFPDNGPFWSNCDDRDEFERVMNFVTQSESEEWEKTRQRYIHDLIEYDPGNIRFISCLKELDVPLR